MQFSVIVGKFKKKFSHPVHFLLSEIHSESVKKLRTHVLKISFTQVYKFSTKKIFKRKKRFFLNIFAWNLQLKW